jgi:cyclopropane fatty-acyl-phospholipid synthase-like methyltransferase
MERRRLGSGRPLGTVRGSRREAVARAAGIEAGASVLDVGCGSGEFCELAAARAAR